MRNDPEVRQAADQYQLGLPKSPVAGSAGELLGRSSGSSLEFQEHREYIPGDDVRHLDWAAYARSDKLFVRLYREEISPRTEILLDASASMTSGGSVKSTTACRLAGLFATLAAELGARPSVLLLDDRRPLESVPYEQIDGLSQTPFNGRATLPELIGQNLVPMRRQSVRIVISDFMFEHDPQTMIQRLAGNASTLWVIQLLNEWESNPNKLGNRRLIDLESGAEVDLIVDEKTIDEYRVRLTRLQRDIARNCRRTHALYALAIAEKGLADLCRDDLCPVGMLRAT